MEPFKISITESDLNPKGDKYTFTYKRTYIDVVGLPESQTYHWICYATDLRNAYQCFGFAHEKGTYISKVVVEKREMVVFGE